MSDEVPLAHSSHDGCDSERSRSVETQQLKNWVSWEHIRGVIPNNNLTPFGAVIISGFVLSCHDLLSMDPHDQLACDARKKVSPFLDPLCQVLGH